MNKEKIINELKYWLNFEAIQINKIEVIDIINLIKDIEQQNQKYKEVIDKLKEEINNNMYSYDDDDDCGVDCCCDGFKLLDILKEVE